MVTVRVKSGLATILAAIWRKSVLLTHLAPNCSQTGQVPRVLTALLLVAAARGNSPESRNMYNIINARKSK